MGNSNFCRWHFHSFKLLFRRVSFLLCIHPNILEVRVPFSSLQVHKSEFIHTKLFTWIFLQEYFFSNTQVSFSTFLFEYREFIAYLQIFCNRKITISSNVYANPSTHWTPLISWLIATWIRRVYFFIPAGKTPRTLICFYYFSNILEKLVSNRSFLQTFF